MNAAPAAAPWRGLAVTSAALFFPLLSFSSYNAALTLIQADWELSNASASLMFSTYLAGFALSSLLLVPLTDRVSPVILLRGGLVFLVAGQLLFAAAAGPWSGAAFRFLMGVGHVVAYISGVQWVARRFHPSQRGTAIGVFVGVGYAGTTISFVLTGWLLAVTGGWRPAYAAAATLGLAGILLAFWIPGEESTAREPDRALPTRGRLDLSILRSRPLFWVILAYGLHTAELYLARLWFPQLLAAQFSAAGLSPLAAAARGASLAGWMFMTSIAAVFLGGRWSDRWGRTKTAGAIFLISGVCSLAAGWLLRLPPIWLLLLGFVYGFATAADSAIYSTAVTELSPPERLGSAQAVQSFAGFAIGAAVPVVAGSLLDWQAGPAGWVLAFTFNGLLALVGVWGLQRLRRLPEAVDMAAGRR